MDTYDTLIQKYLYFLEHRCEIAAGYHRIFSFSVAFRPSVAFGLFQLAGLRRLAGLRQFAGLHRQRYPGLPSSSRHALTGYIRHEFPEDTGQAQ